MGKLNYLFTNAKIAGFLEMKKLRCKNEIFSML